MIVIYHDAFLANYIRYTCIVYIGIVIFVMFNFFFYQSDHPCPSRYTTVAGSYEAANKENNHEKME